MRERTAVAAEPATAAVDLACVARLDCRISPDAQRAVLAETIRAGADKTVIEGGQPIWRVHRARSPVAQYSEGIGYDFFARMRRDIAWQWRDIPLAGLVEPLVRPVLHLFEAITRVDVLGQIPERAIPAHRDLVPGQEYAHMQHETSVKVGDARLRYQGTQTFQAVHGRAEDTSLHARQRYLALKIPLSEREDDYGRPYVIFGDTKYLYDPRHHYFLLNEYEWLHGADAVPFWRGVICVDGIMSPSQLALVRRSAVPVRAVDGEVPATC